MIVNANDERHRTLMNTGKGEKTWNGIWEISKEHLDHTNFMDFGQPNRETCANVEFMACDLLGLTCLQDPLQLSGTNGGLV